MTSSLRVLIASDHAGFELKNSLQRLLPHVTWEDLGPKTADRVDYPDFAEKLGRTLTSQNAGGSPVMGILICGSGIGMSMAANKIHGIRAALVENPVAARLSREHNNANVLCLGSRFLAPEYAAEIANAWLTASASSDPRHQQRIQKIMKLES